MRQHLSRLLLFPVGIWGLSVVLEPAIPSISPALAAGEGGIITGTPTPLTPRESAVPIPDSGQTTKPLAPMLRLLSEIPILKQLVIPPGPAIGVNSTSFSFSAQQGQSNPLPQLLTVTNKGGGILTWNAISTEAWLALSPASGTGNGTVTISPALGSLGVGPHTANILLSAPGASPLSVSVTFAVTAPPVPPAIGVSAPSLSFTAQHGQSNPLPQLLTVTNKGGGILTWNAISTEAWLTLSPASGSGNGTMTISPVLGSLGVGPHTANILLNAPGASPLSVSVTFTVTAPPVPPAIGVSAPSLSFTAQQGGSNPAAQTLSISNTGGGTLNWTASNNASWLTLSPASGTNSGTVTISPALGSLGVGPHIASITLNAPGAPTVSVSVTLTVTAIPVPPTIGVSAPSLSFTAQQGGSNPAAQTLSISNTGGGTLNWTASNNASWLTLSPASGTNSGTVTISPALGSLGVGPHIASITLNAPGAPTVSVPVTFTVTPPPPSITLSPSSLTYTGVSGGANPTSKAITVTSNGNWTVSDNVAWLTLSPTSGSGNGTITASVELGVVSAGTNTATILVTSGGITRTVNVTLNLSTPSLTLSSNSLAFTATQDAANPPEQTIIVQSNITWTAKEEQDAPWLTLSSKTPGKITAQVNTLKAILGSNTATIIVTGSGITKTAVVTLKLNPKATSSATLTWNPNTEKDLAGYKVYRSTTPGTYSKANIIATIGGNVTTYQAENLNFGTTYYFVITAFDIAGNESGYSNEVSKSIF